MHTPVRYGTRYGTVLGTVRYRTVLPYCIIKVISILNKVASILGYAAKQVEDRKSKTYADSPHPVPARHGGRHTLVPFAMEDGGRIGAHGQATLSMLVGYAVAKGKLPPLPARAAPLLPPEAVAMWVRRWQQRMSVWLHLTLSRQVLRYLAHLLLEGLAFSRLPVWQYP